MSGRTLQHELTKDEAKLLQDEFRAEHKVATIRLREGEYQYDLAQAVASFQLELCFPNVKDIIGRLYGEGKADDLQFVRKIQTVLKKMEKSNIVRILPKKKPWELQRYALLSFKFEDSDRNQVSFAQDQQIQQAKDLLQALPNEREASRPPIVKLCGLVSAITVSYAAVLWSLAQATISPAVFVPALSISALCSLVLGKTISEQ